MAPGRAVYLGLGSVRAIDDRGAGIGGVLAAWEYYRKGILGG